MKTKFLSLFMTVILLVATFSQVMFAASGDVWITLSSSSLGANEGFDVEIHIDTGGNNLGAFNMYLDFDSDDATVLITNEDSGISLGVDAAGYTIMANPDNISSGYYRFAGICAQNCANGTDIHLATIHMQTQAGFDSNSSSLTLRVNELSNELGTAITAGVLTGANISSNNPDITAPIRSTASPSSDIAAGNTTATISLITDENAICRYSTSTNTIYDSMTNNFTTTGGTSHSVVVSGLSDGNTYDYYVRCIDDNSNANNDDFSISFSVLPDTIAPERSNHQPGGSLNSGTTETTISLNTNENATCRYSINAGDSYDSMTNNFTTTGGTSHSVVVSGLSDGNNYHYYVRCVDDNNNQNISDLTISFQINNASSNSSSGGSSGGSSSGSSVDTNTTLISNGTPSGNLSWEIKDSIIAVNTNKSSTCRYSTEAGISYSSMTNEFDSTGGISHSFKAGEFTPGNTYTYYIRCQNSVQLATADDYIVSFHINPRPNIVSGSHDNGMSTETGSGDSAKIDHDKIINKINFSSDFTPTTLIIKDTGMYGKLKGKILLKVEDNGRAYYIHPQTEVGYYLGRPRDAFNIMRQQGIGITNKDLEKIPFGLERLVGDDSDGDGLPDLFEEAIGTNKNSVDTDGDGYGDKDELAAGYSPLGLQKLATDDSFTNKHQGKIFLQVENNGESWYIHQGKRYYLGRPDGAFEIMRFLSLGISNNDFDKFSVEE